MFQKLTYSEYRIVIKRIRLLKWIWAPSLPFTGSETLGKVHNLFESLNLWICVCEHMHAFISIYTFIYIYIIAISYLYLSTYRENENKRLEGHIYQKVTMMVIWCWLSSLYFSIFSKCSPMYMCFPYLYSDPCSTLICCV